MLNSRVRAWARCIVAVAYILICIHTLENIKSIVKLIKSHEVGRYRWYIMFIYIFN